MTTAEFLSIEGLNKKQIATAKRWEWSSKKSGKPNKLEACKTAEEALALVNGSFKAAEQEIKPVASVMKLEDMTIAELQDLLDKIPAIIEAKKQAQIADIDAQIAQLKELKKELTK